MKDSISDFYTTISNIDSSNINDIFERLVNVFLAKKIVYNKSTHYIDMAFFSEGEILLVKNDI